MQCVGVLFFVCLPVMGWADTNAGGAISANTVWNAAASPYIVTENVTVNAGVTLTNDPGEVNTGIGFDIGTCKRTCR